MEEFLYENGQLFREFRSHHMIGVQPLVCIANGRHPGTGKLAVAEGDNAIGQFSIAVAAIGQFGIAGTGVFQSAITFFGAVGQQVGDI